ncbi:MAG: hypothetical protein Q7T20_10285 [Saprospiraceae bacterium]|nr:hypothetical protein [Saprospiraceae bacterium]
MTDLQRNAMDLLVSSFVRVCFHTFFPLVHIPDPPTFRFSRNRANANAYQNQALGLRVLRAALERGGHIPKRACQSVEQLKEHWLWRRRVRWGVWALAIDQK